MLLLADLLIPVSAPPVADAGIRVAGGRIAEVGPAAELRARFPDEETRVFDGCALLPGFVDSHTHLELSAFRGFTRASTFGSWMFRLLLARRRLGPADYEVSALWGAYECARCGITSIADTAYDGVAVARAAGVAGLRARVYQEVFGLDDADIPATMGRLKEAVGRLLSQCGPLVEAGVSPHAPYTVSARLYGEAAAFARDRGLRIATHVAESPAEVELLDRGTGAIAGAYRRAGMWDADTWNPPHARPLDYVAGTGALTPEALVIHAVQVDGREIGLLAACGAGVAHCPRSNARLSCGVAPVSRLLAADVPVGLGTDSLASNDSLDMFAEMRAALVAGEQRVSSGGVPVEPSVPGPPSAAPGSRGGVSGPLPAPAGRESAPAAHGAAAAAPTAHDASPPALTGPLAPEQVLRMATWDGARALGWGEVTGSLEPGKSADIIAVRLPGFGERPSPHSGVRKSPRRGSGDNSWAGPGDNSRAGPGDRSRAGGAETSRAGGADGSSPGPIEATDSLVQNATAADVCMTMVAGRVIFEAGTPPAQVASGYQAARQKLGLR